MKKKLLIFFAFCFLTAAVFAKESQRIENKARLLHSHTLENGLSVFVIEDESSALLHLEFVVRAGYSAQEASTTGFIPLFAKLFSSTAKHLEQNAFEIIPLQSECLADSAVFKADLPSEFLEDFLQTLSLCALSPVFSDSDIKSEYEALKKEVDFYSESTAGFINSAIDSQVFADAPWKQESGIYPALFAGKSVSELRSVLTHIGQSFYVPQNTAIFITGNCQNQKVLGAIKHFFSDWQNPARFQNRAYVWKSQSAQRKFVLTSPYFSKDMTQLVIQFTGLSMSQCDLLSSAFNAPQSVYKTKLTKDKKLGIRGNEYLAAASAQKNGSSRFILQTLFEKELTSGKTNPVQQTERFLLTAKEAATLSRKDFIKAQEAVTAKYKMQTGSSLSCMETMAQVWALSSATSGEKFYQSFLDIAHEVQLQKENEIAELINKEEPFIFLLINDSLYKSERDNFQKNGYVEIKAENASWYKNELLAQKAKAEANAKPDKDQLLLTSIINSGEIRPVESFYFKNEKQISSFVLSNGIPLTVKENPESGGAVISVCIQGGELSSPKKERLLRTVLINAFARSIQGEINLARQQELFSGQTRLSAWTEETVSYITLSCMKEDIKEALTAITNAVIYGEITPVAADSLVSEQAYQWNMKSANLGFQLRNNALAYLYRGTDFLPLFSADADTPLLQNTNYQSIALSYTRLLDASLYSLVIAGDISPKEIPDMTEKTFGLLKEQGLRTETSLPSPAFKNKTRNVQLRHLYSTDKTPDLAPSGVPILVPTEEFFDPAQIFFPAPVSYEKRSLFNALLFDLTRRTQSLLTKKYTCSSKAATSIIPVGMIQASDLKYASAFTNAFQKAYKELYASLSKNDEQCLKNLRSAWEKETLLKTQTNEGTASLIQEGLLAGRATEYLDSYLAVENATCDDFIEVLTKYFVYDTALKVYSVDSKK